METERMVVARLPPIGSNQAHQISPRHTNKYDGLNGPNYSIGGKQQKYNLPPPHKLRPFQDTIAGGLETWPAHATEPASNVSVVLTRNKQLVLVDEEAMGKPQMVPKPRFLEQLEAFLKKELKSLGVSAVEPSELRLQAHREVFEYLIEDFKTYKPLLSSIKNEYEMMLAFQRAHIRQLEPLKQMLVTVSEQCDQKIVALRDMEKQEMVDVKNENKKLYARIDELRQEQRALEAQVERLQEELAAEYLRYRDECDARKLLISDINDLRYQQEDMMMSKQSMEDVEEDKEDPVTLKIALKKAREDEAAATARLNEIEANYGDVIPRREFEGMQKQYGVLNEHFETFKGDFVKLQEEHNTLLEVHKQVLQQRDDYYVESERLRQSATPRPDWDKCSEFVAGGQMRWQELAEGKTSDQLVDVLLTEVSGRGGADQGGAEYFEGQGTGPSIPKYLQHEGKVRNRRLGKRDTALLVRDIWREKGSHDAGKQDKRDKLSDFLSEYLKRRFGLEQMVVEWAYNLHDACQRFQHDDNIGMFWQCLNEEMEEEVYHHQLMTIAKLLNALTKQDLDKGNQGAIIRDEFQTLLTDFFPGVDETSVLTLVNAAVTELEMGEEDVNVEYKNLFMEDDEGTTGPFLEELKKYLKNERLQFVEDIQKELGTTSPVTVDELKAAISATDPEADGADVERILCWTYRVEGAEKFPECEALEQPPVIARLQNGHLKRVTKKQQA